jgi:hypothetical protein
MDLMIEAKDKEQAVFELMRRYSDSPAGTLLTTLSLMSARTITGRRPRKLIRGMRWITRKILRDHLL